MIFGLTKNTLTPEYHKVCTLSQVRLVLHVSCIISIIEYIHFACGFAKQSNVVRVYTSRVLYAA